MNAYLDGMRNFLTFTGRANRAQYWQFVLGVVILLLTALFLDSIFNDNPFRQQRYLTMLVTVVHFVPFVAISIRRLHDTDRPGWWYLVNGIPLGQLIFIALMMIPSTPGENRYGSPVAADAPGASWNGFGDVRQAVAVTEAYTPAKRAAEAPMSPTVRDDADLVTQLERLSGLRTLGELTDDEYAAAKAKLLSRV